MISDLWERLLAAIDAVDRIGIKLIRIKKTRNPYASVQSIQSAIPNRNTRTPQLATRNLRLAIDPIDFNLLNSI